jgi:hypothetical protein
MHACMHRYCTCMHPFTVVEDSQQSLPMPKELFEITACCSASSPLLQLPRLGVIFSARDSSIQLPEPMHMNHAIACRHAITSREHVRPIFVVFQGCSPGQCISYRLTCAPRYSYSTSTSYCCAPSSYIQGLAERVHNADWHTWKDKNTVLQ